MKLNRNYTYKFMFLFSLFSYGYITSKEILGISLINAIEYLLGGTLTLLIDTTFRFILSFFAVLYNSSDFILFSNYQNLN